MDKSNNHSITKKRFVIVLFLSLLLVIYSLFKSTNFRYYLSLASDFIYSPIEKIESNDGRVNILLLGRADEDHAGSELTDTIIVASVGIDKPGVTLISIPRDVWIPEIRAKINSAYYWGNQKEPKEGLNLSKSTVSNILSIPVHYSLVVDFSGFKNVIDVLGGIEVDVQNSFVDEKYPITGKENDLCDGDKTFKCRYETIKFEKGKQMMSGDTALKFVRSRNAEGDQGTDIAREGRQQLVISAIKEKALSPEILLSPKKIRGLIEVALDSLETDINPSTAAVLSRKVLSGKDFIKYNLIPEEMLVNPPISSRYDNQYVFIPRDGNWSEIRSWLQNLLNS